MWKRTFEKDYPGIKKEDIWNLWTDVNQWTQWHDDLDYCKLSGAFEIGNHFMLKPKGAPAVKIMLTDIKENEYFSDCTNFFGAKMINTHGIEETPEGLKLTNTLIVTGPLKRFWIKLVAQHVADSVPDETDALVRLARSLHG